MEIAAASVLSYAEERPEPTGLKLLWATNRKILFTTAGKRDCDRLWFVKKIEEGEVTWWLIKKNGNYICSPFSAETRTWRNAGNLYPSPSSTLTRDSCRQSAPCNQHLLMSWSCGRREGKSFILRWWELWRLEDLFRATSFRSGCHENHLISSGSVNIMFAFIPAQPTVAKAAQREEAREWERKRNESNQRKEDFLGH